MVKFNKGDDNMGRPSGTKNVMRTPEEKEKLVKEYFNSKVGYRKFAESNDIYPSIFCKWIKLYRENGIEGLKSKTGKANKPNNGKYNRNKCNQPLGKPDDRGQAARRGAGNACAAFLQCRRQTPSFRSAGSGETDWILWQINFGTKDFPSMRKSNGSR